MSKQLQKTFACSIVEIESEQTEFHLNLGLDDFISEPQLYYCSNTTLPFVHYQPLVL